MDETEKIKPRPCPFCGKEPVLRPTNPDKEGDAWGAVTCVNAYCPTYSNTHGHGVDVHDGEEVADERGTAADIACAIERWNRGA